MTGVRTCALPIYGSILNCSSARGGRPEGGCRVSDDAADVGIGAFGAERNRHRRGRTIAPEPAVLAVEGRDELALLARRLLAFAIAVIIDAGRIATLGTAQWRERAGQDG